MVFLAEIPFAARSTARFTVGLATAAAPAVILPATRSIMQRNSKHRENGKQARHSHK
jgi:hypothetical protein